MDTAAAQAPSTEARLPEPPLSELNLSEAAMSRWYRIVRLDGPEMECRRLMDLGFTPGEGVAVVRSTPLGDPLVVIVRGTQLALRKREASWIQIRDGSEPDLFSSTKRLP